MFLEIVHIRSIQGMALEDLYLVDLEKHLILNNKVQYLFLSKMESMHLVQELVEDIFVFHHALQQPSLWNPYQREHAYQMSVIFSLPIHISAQTLHILDLHL